jgi:hypothetical protein
MPVPNKEAKSPIEVYDINELLGVTQAEFERATLDLSAKFAMASNDVIRQWKEKNIYTDFVIEHLMIYANSKYGHQYKLQKCKQLAYMHFLLSLYRMKANQLRTKSPLSAAEVSDLAINKLFDLYTCVSNANAYAKNVRSMPRRLKDKLTCHILILALHVDDFATCIDTFQHDLKLSMQRLSDFYQALGCFVKSSVVQANGKKLVHKKASLTLPLNDCKNFEPKKKQRKNN